MTTPSRSAAERLREAGWRNVNPGAAMCWRSPEENNPQLYTEAEALDRLERERGEGVEHGAVEARSVDGAVVHSRRADSDSVQTGSVPPVSAEQSAEEPVDWVRVALTSNDKWEPCVEIREYRDNHLIRRQLITYRELAPLKARLEAAERELKHGEGMYIAMTNRCARAELDLEKAEAERDSLREALRTEQLRRKP